VIDLYDFQLAFRHLGEREQPVCRACAAGYHEHFLPSDEYCDCPCHCTQTQCVDDRVAV
jgi:hypothetical protein